MSQANQGVFHFVGQSGRDLFVDADIEKSFHHAGLGDGCAAAHRQEQRIRRVAEAFPGGLLQLVDVMAHLLSEIFAYRVETVDELTAAEGFGGDDEPGGNRQAQVLQFEQIEPFVAHIYDAHGLVVDLVQAGNDPLGIEMEQQMEFVIGQHVGLVEQGVQDAGQKQIELLQS